MIPIEFKQQNNVLGKPENMTEEQCKPLPVFMGQDAEGFPICVSCWKLTPEEIEQVKKSGNIYLVIVGRTQPPVSLHSEPPFYEMTNLPPQFLN